MIYVSRLRQLYWPKDILGHYTLRSVLAARPRPRYVSEITRSDAYDLGRVRWMYDQVVAGRELNPIEIDWSWSRSGSPANVMIVDGHHRFVAYVFARKRQMPAILSGPVDGIQWLEGKTNVRPDWF